MAAADAHAVTAGPAARYRALLRAGALRADPAQAAAADRLDRLCGSLDRYDRAAVGGLMARLGFGRRAAPPPRGVYLHGDVGRGKSMLMDLLFDAAPVERKRRVHFHEFMQQAHELIHDWRRTRVRRASEPIRPTARRLAEQAWLLCFDEMEVRDIADAMIVSRLFAAMFELGVVVVATSNRHPDDLYRGGLQRTLFLPFIDLLKDRLDLVDLGDGLDYRLERMRNLKVYHSPADAAAESALARAFAELTGGAPAQAERIAVKGRVIAVPAAARGVARFSFAGLCEAALGPGDYLAIARRYRTVILSGIPVMDDLRRDALRRFMVLIDTLYDRGVNLVASAAAAPAALYAGEDWAFEFSRTVSRLTEMQSADYIRAAGHRQRMAAPGAAPP